MKLFTDTINDFHKACELGLEDYILEKGGMRVSGKNGVVFIRGTVVRVEAKIAKLTKEQYKCDMVFKPEDDENICIEVVNSRPLSKEKKKSYLDNGQKYVVFYASDIGSHLSYGEARKAAKRSAEIYGLNFLD